VEILLFWLPGRVAGPEAGPGRKWQGLGPALSIASAATDEFQTHNELNIRKIFAVQKLQPISTRRCLTFC